VDAVQHDLRERLARRQQEKAEMERQVHAVQRRYQEEVAPLKEKVLRLQMERLRRAAQRNMRSARYRNAYHDAQRAYETFRDERPPPADPAAPDDLKRRYRAASKRCHPDVVPEPYRAQAAATFQALESAYQAGHARAVRAIADALEQWGFPGIPATGEHADERGGPELRRAVSALETAIASLRERDAYQALADAEDVDAALRAQKEGLRQVLAELRKRQARA
jgi:hypothetical protein